MWWLPWAIGEASLVTGLARTRVDWSNSRKYFWSPVASLLTTLVADIGVWGFGIAGDSWFHFPARTAAIVGMGYLAGKFWARKPPERASSIKRERGTEIRDTPRPQPARGLGRARDQRITLAGVPLELKDEAKHFKIIGTTGSGKTTAITGALEKALARGDRVIIADPNGDYMSRFYDPGRGDLILNPFRQDSVPWSLLGEIREPKDIENMALAFLPDNGSADTRMWNEHGRTFFQAVAKQLITAAGPTGGATDAELYRLLSAPVEELRKLLRGTAAESFLEEGNDRFFGSVRSTVTTAFKGLEHIIQQRETIQQRSPGLSVPALSVRNWIEQGNQPGKRGILFMPYRANEPAMQRMISAWMRTAIFETLSQSPNEDRRLWFVVDELAAVGAVDGMNKAMTQLRKHGGRMVIGFQSIAQVRATYGEAEANTIVENARNSLILNSSSSEHGGTAEFASRLIGDAEVIETTSSNSLGPTDWIGSRTKSQRFAMRRAVLASEIEQLLDLHGYLKVASKNYWMSVELSIPSTRTHAAAAPSASPAAAPSAGLLSAATAAPVAAPMPPAAAVPATTSKPAAKRVRVTKKKAAAARTRGSKPATTTAAAAPSTAPASKSTPAQAAGPRNTTTAAESNGGSKRATSDQKSEGQKPGDQKSRDQQSGQQSLPLGPPAAPPTAAAAPSTAPASKSTPAQAAGPRKRRAAGSPASKTPDPSDDSAMSRSRSIPMPVAQTYRSLRVQEHAAKIEASRSNSVPTISSSDKQESRTSTPASTADPPSSSSLARGAWVENDTSVPSHGNSADAKGSLTQEQDNLIQEIQNTATKAFKAGQPDKSPSNRENSTSQNGSTQSQGYDKDMGIT